jgi:hypothetical protein
MFLHLRFKSGVIVALALGISTSALKSAQAQSTLPTTQEKPQASGAANNCGCPQIPAVATSDKPAPGKVLYELSFNDLEDIFSNREAHYGGDWDKALTALAHEIDPNGAWKIWSASAPTADDDTAIIQEGALSSYLINGTTQAGRGTGRWRNAANGRDLMEAILRTLARTNKYGEPIFNLRNSLLRAARFLADDLANVPVDSMRTDEKARKIGHVAFEARGQLFATLEGARPKNLARAAELAARASPGAARPDELSVDPTDLANAALDVLLSIDDNGEREGILAFREQDSGDLVRALVQVIAARPIFGGTAAAGSPQDAVDCKALSVLVTLADAAAADGGKFRVQLLNLAGSTVRPLGLPGGEPAEFEAARTAFILAGFSSGDEARKVADALYEVGEALEGNEFAAGRDAVTMTMRAIAGFAGGPGRDTFRVVFASELAKKFDGLPPKRYLDSWKAAEASWRQQTAQQLCAPQETPPRVLVYAKGVFRDYLVDKLYQNVPLMVVVVFAEPYDDSEYPVALQIGGGSLDLVAKPIDAAHTMFGTEVFMVKPK